MTTSSTDGKRIVDYMVIAEHDIDLFMRQVSKRVREGWEFYGPLVMGRDIDDVEIFARELVRTRPAVSPADK